MIQIMPLSLLVLTTKHTEFSSTSGNFGQKRKKLTSFWEQHPMINGCMEVQSIIKPKQHSIYLKIFKIR